MIDSGPPVDVRVTLADAVTDPAALVAVKTYVVVVSGLTFTVPLAEVDARFPGAMLSVVAPDVRNPGCRRRTDVMLCKDWCYGYFDTLGCTLIH